MSTKSTLVYSLGVNVTVITLKAVVGTWTGSAAMLAEASHSLVDSLTGPLLLAGEWHRTRWAKGPHFWGLLAAVNMALLGGGYAAWEGIRSILDPATTTDIRMDGYVHTAFDRSSGRGPEIDRAAIETIIAAAKRPRTASAADKRFVIYTSGIWVLGPSPDPNVVYSFHFYDPVVATMPAASGGAGARFSTRSR